MLCTESELCLSRYMQTYSSILSIIKAYSRILRHFQAYSGKFSTLCNPRIFTTIFQALTYLEPEVYSKACQNLIRHTQNPTIVRTFHSGIIQPYAGIFRTLCNTCICRNLAYSESWNVQNHSITGS